MPKALGSGPRLSNVNKLLIHEADVLYDQINQSWLAVEKHVQEAGVLKPVMLRIGHTEDGDFHCIGVQKINGIWRICSGLLCHSPNDDEVVTWGPVGDRSIQDRIFYLSYIQELFEAIVKSNEEVVANLRDAATKADETLRSLGLK